MECGERMSRVFLSHSSRDRRQAMAVKRWLVGQEPGLAEEIFLDLDPHTGIRPGERWKQALQQANTHCEAVICLLSAHWERSHECITEFRFAEMLNKTIVCARLEPGPQSRITSEWQRCDLFGDGPTTAITVDEGEPVMLATAGLHRLLDGLRALGIGAEYFPWPPPHDRERAPYRGWAPLEEDDAAVFFGRDAQIVQGLDELRGMRFSGVKSLLVILGPSGAGKSSFLRAGLLPRLRRDDRKFLPMDIVRPEHAVLTGELGLAPAIYHLRTGLGLPTPLLGEIKNACLACDVERLRGWLTEARQAARARLLEVPADQSAPTLMLPLDQGEELFNADAGPQAPRFLHILAGLLRREAGVTPGLIVAVTIRADRYEPLQTAPQLAGIQSVVFDELKPMPPAGFKEVITGPAGRATAAGRRLRIEPALVDRLLADSAAGADALPLLALTLQRLYHDFGDGGDLTARRVRVDGRDGAGGADRGRHPARRRPRRPADPARASARCVHPVAGHHQPRQRSADAPTGPLHRPAGGQPPPDRGVRGETAAGQGHPRRAGRCRGRPGKPAAPMARTGRPGCVPKATTSRTPTPWSAPPPTGRPTAATQPGCWRAPASPRPKPWPPNPASATGWTPPATSCTPPAPAKTTASRPRSNASKPNSKPSSSTRPRCGNAHGSSSPCWRSPPSSP